MSTVPKTDGEAAFCCATPTIAKTLRIMGLLKVAEIYNTEPEAKKSLAALA